MMKDEKGLISQALAFKKMAENGFNPSTTLKPKLFSVVPAMGGINPVSQPFSSRSIG
jgi:hypothetical protein